MPIPPVLSNELPGPHTIWDIEATGENLLLASSDGGVYLMTGKQPSRVLGAFHTSKNKVIKALELSPDKQTFIAVAQEKEQALVLYYGRLNPFKLEGQLKLSPEMGSSVTGFDWNASHIWLSTNQGRLSLTHTADGFEPQKVYHSNLGSTHCQNASTQFQGQGWTLWSRFCSDSETPEDPDNAAVYLEQWSLETGQTIKLEKLDLSAYAESGWGSVALASDQNKLYFVIGNIWQNVLLMQRTRSGEYQGLLIPDTDTGGPGSLLALPSQLYVGLQWPGSLTLANSSRLALDQTLWPLESPMSLVVLGQYIYIGTRFGALLRLPLGSGRLEFVYLSEELKPKEQQ